MNGNITEEGIKEDLEWMHRIGVGGFQNFDAALNTPQVVQRRLSYMTPEWKRAFLYATKLAGQLELDEGIAASAGWSETGGPWVPPSQGMKKFVWSETRVEGGRPFTGKLGQPPSVTGPFQNLALAPDKNRFQGTKLPQFYADSAVVAYKLPPVEISADRLHPTVAVSGGDSAVALLSDGDLLKAFKLPIASPKEVSWISYEFPGPQAIRSLTIVKANDQLIGRTFGEITSALEASDDGLHFRTVCRIPNDGAIEHTLSFPTATARWFRVTFQRPSLSTGASASTGTTKVPTDYEIAELVLHPDARVDRFEEKSGFATVPDLYQFATPAAPAGDVISQAGVISLTSKMHSDGTLDWTPPAGSWMVLRFGYSLLGITNHPATAEATGLEVDKLNHTYVKNYMDNYLDSYKKTVGGDFVGAHGISNVVTDSWEAGPQNWTDDMILAFKKRRGYDPLPWMPVLTGRIVQSAIDSDRFLWDFRKTIADMTAEEHYGQVAASLKEWGLSHYGESHETGRAFIADGMEVKKLDDIPMSAMWTQSPGVNNELYGYNADDRESASVAHIYGQNLAAAESMTAKYAPWAWSPATLKPTADKEFAEGINRVMIHSSVHQPLLDKSPGLSLGIYGQWFNRNETWAEDAAPWITYLARNSFLLQQGHFVADILYFYGEDSNLTAIFAHGSPNLPAGYAYDYVNADALLHKFSVKGGRISTESGMCYRLLVLDPYSKYMSLPVLKRIRNLVSDGAVVVGEKPLDTPSLADSNEEFHQIVNEMWGAREGEHAFGKGKIYAGRTVSEVLNALNNPPDFDYSKSQGDTKILFVHRRLADGDVYYLDNRSEREEQFDGIFRVDGSEAELWHADTGITEDASYTLNQGRTTVPLRLEPWGTVFVVFRKSAATASRKLPRILEAPLGAIAGPWDLSFQQGRGAPTTVVLKALASWSDNPDPGVRYFSGTGTYTRSIQASTDWFKPGTHLWIDLGSVKNLAEVVVNGQSLGVLWHPPYRIDATAVLRPGVNQLTIKVTNSWVNRLIGDQQPRATKYSFTIYHPYNAGSDLLPSGLLGPVQLLSTSEER